MADEITPAGAAYAVARWEAAYTAFDQDRMADAGDDLKDVVESLLRQLERSRTLPEPVLPKETYTEAGLPRRAAARARENGATIGYTLTGIRVDFPNGSWVHQNTSVTRLVKGRAAWRGPIQRHDGAVPGCKPPTGSNLEDVLNAYADAEEGRA